MTGEGRITLGTAYYNESGGVAVPFGFSTRLSCNKRVVYVQYIVIYNPSTTEATYKVWEEPAEKFTEMWPYTTRSFQAKKMGLSYCSVAGEHSVRNIRPISWTPQIGICPESILAWDERANDYRRFHVSGMIQFGEPYPEDRTVKITLYAQVPGGKHAGTKVLGDAIKNSVERLVEDNALQDFVKDVSDD